MAPVLDRRAHPLVRRPRHRPRQPAPLRAPAGEAEPLLQAHRRHRVPLPLRRARSGASSRASPTAPTSTSARTAKHSGQDLSYFDQATDERYTPYVIEPAAGLSRSLMTFLVDAYAEDEAPNTKGGVDKRTVLRLDPRLAPVKVAVLPLSRNADLSPEGAATSPPSCAGAGTSTSTTPARSAAATAARTRSARRTASPSTSTPSTTTPSPSASATPCSRSGSSLDAITLLLRRAFRRLLIAPALHNGRVPRRVARPGRGVLLCRRARCSPAAPTTTRVRTPTTRSSTESTPSRPRRQRQTESSLPVPDGVELTAAGQRAGGRTRPRPSPTRSRQDVVGVLDITVTRLEKTSFEESFDGWDLDAEAEEVEPVLRARHRHQPRRDRPRRPPAAALRRRRHQHPDRVDRVREHVQAVRARARSRRSSRPGKKVKVCLVYLAPNKGDLTAVSFRPTQEFDPITWTGELKKPKPPKKDKKHRAARATRATSEPDRLTAHDRRRDACPDELPLSCQSSPAASAPGLGSGPGTAVEQPPDRRAHVLAERADHPQQRGPDQHVRLPQSHAPTTYLLGGIDGGGWVLLDDRGRNTALYTLRNGGPHKFRSVDDSEDGSQLPARAGRPERGRARCADHRPHRRVHLRRVRPTRAAPRLQRVLGAARLRRARRCGSPRAGTPGPGLRAARRWRSSPWAAWPPIAEQDLLFTVRRRAGRADQPLRTRRRPRGRCPRRRSPRSGSSPDGVYVAGSETRTQQPPGAASQRRLAGLGVDGASRLRPAAASGTATDRTGWCRCCGPDVGGRCSAATSAVTASGPPHWSATRSAFADQIVSPGL